MHTVVYFSMFCRAVVYIRYGMGISIHIKNLLSFKRPKQK